MNFDRIAPHYRWLETLVFGNQLQEARVAFVREIGAPRRVLIAGEGDGRFLTEFVRSHPTAAVDCLEASGRMIQLARAQAGDGRTNFIHADVRDISLEANCYDLIVTHFFLDCFGPGMLAEVIAKLANAAVPDAQWLVADFCEPAKSWRHLPARFLIAIMYSFFRLIAGIEARRLVDYRPFLQADGFTLTRTFCPPNQVFRSQLWRRNYPPG